MNKIKNMIVLFIVTVFFQPGACVKGLLIDDKLTDEEIVAKAVSRPEKQFGNYKFNPDLKFSERVKEPPGFIMKYVRELDQKEYTHYMPRAKELKLMDKAFTHLPPLLKRMLDERLIEIYFINDFLGSGMTDWVVDKERNIYCVMYFNPVTVKMDMSEWLTWKEMTCFIKDNKDISVQIEAGEKYSAFTGILLHEAVHVADYVKHITPCVEDNTRALSAVKGEKIQDTPFVKGTWEGLSSPVNDFDFPGRKDISFYTLGGGPKIKISDARSLYESLSRTPFTSLYGSMSWAEDVAEFLLFYHLSQKMKQPYIISVLDKGKVVYSLQPMKGAGVRERFPDMDVFYR